MGGILAQGVWGHSYIHAHITEKLEKPKNQWKKLIPKKIPGLSFFDSIKKFVSGWIFGFVAIKLIPLLPKLIPIVLGLGKIVNFFINVGGKFLNGFISFINFV